MKNQNLIDTAQEATIRFGAATLERFTDEEQRARAAESMHTFGDRATEVAHDLGERLNDRLGDRSTSDFTENLTENLADAATTAAATASSIWASPRGKKIAIGAGIGITAAAAVTYYRRRRTARDESSTDDIDLTDSSPHGVAGWNTPAEAFASVDTSEDS